MSSAFKFTPKPHSSPLPEPGPYLQPFIPAAPQASPFLPPVALQPQYTGYIPPIALPPLAPSTPNVRPQVHFADDTKAGRPRSWSNAEKVPFVWPVPAPALQPTLAPPAPTHGRRHSFGGGQAAAQGWTNNFLAAQQAAAATVQIPQLVPGVPWTLAPPALPTFAVLHPVLMGYPDFAFDLSAAQFAPQWRTAYGPIALKANELDTPATHPSVTSMRVTIDAIPQWPIDLVRSASPLTGLGLTVPLPGSPYSPAPAAPPAVPITLRDVIEAIWRNLHQQITHVDWARLSKSEEAAIGRAYTRRTKGNEEEISQGVKRIDFLLDKYMFHSLQPVNGDLTEMKLITMENK